MYDSANLYQKIYPIFTPSGAKEIPVTDTDGMAINGTYLSEDMAEDFQQGAFFIAFYNSDGNIATPTGGTIEVQLSPIDGQWHSLDRNGQIEATTVGELATYVIPAFCTLVRQGRMTLNDIQGAAYCKAFFWRGITS